MHALTGSWCRALLILLIFAASARYGMAQDTTRLAASPPPLTKNPTTAILMSVALPGLGQYYNEQYWKIPLFTGAAAATAWLFFSNNGNYLTASDNYDAAVRNNLDFLTKDRLKRQREIYRDNRDLAGAFFLLTYLVAAVDSYVGAHLYDFNVDDKLSIGLVPTPAGGALCLRVHF